MCNFLHIRYSHFVVPCLETTNNNSNIQTIIPLFQFIKHIDSTCNLLRSTSKREDTNLPRNQFHCSYLKLKKAFIRILLEIDYRNLKNAPKVWCGNNFGNANNKLNFGCIKFRSTKGWWGVNQIRWDTGTRYVQSEVAQLPAPLTMWGHYLKIYMLKERH